MRVMRKRLDLPTIILRFAAQGVAIEVMARAMQETDAKVGHICQEGVMSGRLPMMPPQSVANVSQGTAVRIAALEEELAEAHESLAQISTSIDNDTRNYRVTFKLRPTEARVLSIIVDKGRVLREMLFHSIYGMRNDCDKPLINTISVHVCNIRKRLRPHNIEISTVHSEGFEISPNNAALIREAVAKCTQHVKSPSIVPEQVSE